MSLFSDRLAADVSPVTRSGPRVYLVVALASNGVIGARGKLPWHVPEDLQHFKRLTLGHPVIMGRRTWESLGKALPGRDNIVVTRRSGYQAAGASVAASVQAALALCADEPVAFVIGGAEIYAAALPLADGLVVTEIDRDYEGDTRFPAWDRNAWKVAHKEAHTSKEGLRFDFVLYERASA